jgi:hypothetical protein
MGEQRIALALLLILSLLLPAFSLPLVSAAEDSWTTLEPMPTARAGLGVAVVDGEIYAIGGFVGTNTVLGTNEMYDPETDTWTTKTSMPTPRAYFAIAVYQHKIYVIGGLCSLLVNTGIMRARIPEFPSWLVLSLFFVATLVGVVAKRKFFRST